MTFIGKLIDKIIDNSSVPSSSTVGYSEKVPDSIMENVVKKEKSVGDTVELSGSDFEKYCRKNNINYKELTNYVRGALGENDKLNSSEKDIQNAKYCLEKAFKYLSEKDNDVDTEKLRNLAEQYYIAVNTGWNIDKFQEEQDKFFSSNNSISSGFKKYCLRKLKLGKLFAKDVTKDEEVFKAYIEDCFKDIDKKAVENLKAKGITNPSAEEINAAKEEIQIQIFGRILANTSREDRDMMMSAVQYLDKDNRYVATKATLGASEDKTDAAHRYLKDRYEICTGMNSDERIQIQELGYHYATKDDVLSASRDDIYMATCCCMSGSSGKSRSRRNMSAKDYYAMAAGAKLGTMGNAAMTPQEKAEALSEIYQSLAENGLTKEVEQTLGSYYDRHKDSVLVSEKQFEQYMGNERTYNITSSASDNQITTANKQSSNTSSYHITSDKTQQERASAKIQTDKNGNIIYVTDGRVISQTAMTSPVLTETKTTKPVKSITQNKEPKPEEMTAEELIRDCGKVEAVATAVCNNNYKQSVRNNLLETYRHADVSTKGEMITAANFGGSTTLIRATSQYERSELVQDNSSVSPQRRKIIKKQYLYDKDFMNEADA